MHLVVRRDICESDDFAVVRVLDFPVDEIIEEEVVEDGEVGVTFELGVEGELGRLGSYRIVVDGFQWLFVIEYSIFSHLFILLYEFPFSLYPALFSPLSYTNSQ